MKKSFLFLLVVVIVFASVIVILMFNSHSNSDDKLLNLPEDELYLEMSKLNSKELIEKINKLEKSYKSLEEKNKLLPLFAALIDKSDEFTANQLIELITDNQTLSGIDNAFVSIYAINGYDATDLMSLLGKDSIADETKEYIVSQGDFTEDQLIEIFKMYDNQIAVTAIKKLSAIAPDKLESLVKESLSSSQNKFSDDKNRAICLAIAGYYEESSNKEEADAVREQFAPVLKEIYEQSSSELVQDEAIYALGRICNNEWFEWIMDNSRINKYTKISVIERNFKMLKAIVDSANSEEEISSVIKAMEFHPILDVGESLQIAINNGTLPRSENLVTLITFIQKEGIKAVDKYEK